ncbi:phage baseplate assembly protein V [Pararhodobacter sp. CCB-MM2]|uniref:phage baseplate assembly protein V n=1 Tax=Pararhodobacter sp. CCB-MM2 TaxID=1786003 RepID=UPI00082B53CC|nr:phage baseplate assembly protein V [Pararhodobacter sp. CCB-MM2]
MARLEDYLDGQRRVVSEISRRRQWQNRTGVVHSVDAGRGLARVQLNDADPPFLTGWIPWSEPSAGSNRTHNPPSVGQQVQLTSESGDLHDAVIQGSLNSNANGRPSAAGDEYVMAAVGEARISITGGGAAIALTVGGVTATLSAAGLALTGGSITHNGKDIGDTHTHGGISPGGANTAPPN